MPRLWPTGGLWRHRDFLKLWSAETISQFGSRSTTSRSASSRSSCWTPAPSKSRFSERSISCRSSSSRCPPESGSTGCRRRPILIIGDFGRAALLATIPIAYVADALTIWQLYIVVFLTGICTVFFDVAYQSYLPSLVERDQIIDGNSKLEISRSAAQLGGPGLAGALVEILTAPYAVLVDAISFLGSGLFLLRIRKPEEAPDERPSTAARRASGRSSRKGSASSSAIPTCARRRAALRRPTSSRVSPSRSSSSSWCASSASPQA